MPNDIHPVHTGNVGVAGAAASRVFRHDREAGRSAADAGGATSSQVRARRSAMLRGVAAALERARDLVIATCAEETALTEAELSPEFERMTGTLRMFADVVDEGSWVRAAIDRPATGDAKSIGPNHDVRRMLMPLGPVAVFGASNFPLAYGVCGGDTASAWAAGCPVVVKEHPAHPRTGRLLARLAHGAIVASGADGAMLAYVLNEDATDHSVAAALVGHWGIRAVGFTGSAQGGFAIMNLAAQRGAAQGQLDFIPVFAEMGSCNVIVVLRDASRNRMGEVVEQIAQSLLARHGQQCTAPGVVLVAGYDLAEAFFEALKSRLAGAPVRRMLSPNVAKTYYGALERAMETGIIEDHTRLPTDEEKSASSSPPVVLYTQAVKMEDEPAIWEEIFGPAVVVAGCGSLASGYLWIPPALTVTIVGEDDSDPLDQDNILDDACIASRATIAEWVEQEAGRIIFNGVPTGVRVCHAMVHGGPPLASNRPDTTAVGPMAIERWCRPVCWQNAPQHLLPPELRDENPLGIWRMVNGEWMRAAAH